MGDTGEERAFEKKITWGVCVYVSEPQRGSLELPSTNFFAWHSCSWHFILQIALSFKEWQLEPGMFGHSKGFSVQCLERLPSGIIPKLQSKLIKFSRFWASPLRRSTLYITKRNISSLCYSLIGIILILWLRSSSNNKLAQGFRSVMSPISFSKVVPY